MYEGNKHETLRVCPLTSAQALPSLRHSKGILSVIGMLQQQSIEIAPTPRLSLTCLRTRHSMFGT